MNVFDINEKYKIILMTFLLVLGLIAFYYSYYILKEGFLFANFLFVPLVLASLWFGYKGLCLTFFILLNMVIANVVEPYEYFTLGFISRIITYVVISIIISSATEIKKKADVKIISLNEALHVLNKILRHDILNDLTVVLSACDMIQVDDERLKIKAINALEKSVSLIEHMRQLENALVSEETLTGKSLENIVKSVVKNYPDIKFNIIGDCIILCDVAIYSVVDNIIRNAVVHGKTDRIDVSINDKGEMRVADYGKGIHPDIKNKIFDEGESFGENRGSGLGLFIVKKIMDRYDGGILVEDNKPNGTVFVLKFKKA